MPEQDGERQGKLGRVSCSVHQLALSMLTGRQPVYRERKKKKSIKEIPLLSIPDWITALIQDGKGWGGVMADEGGQIIFFDEKGAQKMYIRTVCPSGLTSHNFAHLFLFVPRASS